MENKGLSHTFFKKEFRIPGEEKLSNAVRSFGITERLIFYFFVTLFIFTSAWNLYNVSLAFMVEIPKFGGSLTEGVIGSPRFVNPILATGDANYDLTSLVYSGLLKHGSDDTFIPDLAESYSITPDGLIYTFVLKQNATFHDGIPVTTDDIIYTIERAQDPAMKSPRRANWEGVTAEKVDEKTVRITLKQAYAPFLENTTMGILPKHLWQNVTVNEFAFNEGNVKPIGSGPYRVAEVKRSSTGAPLSYALTAFDAYTLGRPYIQTLVIKFYNNESELLSALDKGDIESADGISPEKAKTLLESGYRIERTTLPRIFGVFFNQNEAPIFLNKEIRLALDASLDKKKIVDGVLHGFGVPLSEPIPPSMTALETANEKTATAFLPRLDQARKILTAAGWKMNANTKVFEKVSGKKTMTLSFSISTSNAPELRATAEVLKTTWEALGAKVNLKIFEPSDLNQNIIRPRKYDALLFGEIVGRDLDLFAFWHSSQRNDPGLNIALYTNVKADKLLEQARTISNVEDRMAKIATFETELDRDHPAVFLYAPDFIYTLPTKVRGFAVTNMTVPADRFADIEHWYVETENVWKIFAH